MAEYRFPVPGPYLRKLVDSYARKEGYIFSKEDAIIDLMLAIDRDDVKPYRYYAKRWGWAESTTYKRWKKLFSQVDKWRDFDNITSPVKRKQEGSKREAKNADSKQESRAKEAEGKQEGSSIDHTTYYILKGNIKLPFVISDKMTADQVMISWNVFAKKYDLPTIRELTPKRRDWIRLRRKKICPQLEEIFERILDEPFLIGQVETDRGPYRITFDYLWRNSTNYVKILEGGHWPRTNGVKTNGRKTNRAGKGRPATSAAEISRLYEAALSGVKGTGGAGGDDSSRMLGL